MVYVRVRFSPTAESIMDSDREPHISAPRTVAETARHQVVRTVSDLGSSGGLGNEYVGLSMYLALLQDKLPGYARTMAHLVEQVGRVGVHEGLVAAVRAGIDFYGTVLSAKVSVFTNAAHLAQLRHVLLTNGLGPHKATEALAVYLTKERELGRVPGDVDPLAVSRILQGAAVNRVFTTMLIGDDGVEDTEYAEGIVRALRLGSPRSGRAGDGVM